MEGYCQHCFMTVEMKDVETVKMPNQAFIHRGLCSQPKCDGVIFVKIYDQDLILTDNGHKCPKDVFVGSSTPKRLLIDEVGQTIIKKGEVINTTPKDGKIVTVFDVKKENENENT